MEIDVKIENLVELLTNSVNMTSVFYDVFLNPNPKYVELQQYDDTNELKTVRIPNRALDNYNRSGEGSPEDRIEAPIASLYVDTLTQKVYIKMSENPSNPDENKRGWELLYKVLDNNRMS